MCVLLMFFVAKDLVRQRTPSHERFDFGRFLVPAGALGSRARTLVSLAGLSPQVWTIAPAAAKGAEEREGGMHGGSSGSGCSIAQSILLGF